MHWQQFYDKLLPVTNIQFNKQVTAVTYVNMNVYVHTYSVHDVQTLSAQIIGVYVVRNCTINKIIIYIIYAHVLYVRMHVQSILLHTYCYTKL